MKTMLVIIAVSTTEEYFILHLASVLFWDIAFFCAWFYLHVVVFWNVLFAFNFKGVILFDFSFSLRLLYAVCTNVIHLLN